VCSSYVVESPQRLSHFGSDSLQETNESSLTLYFARLTRKVRMVDQLDSFARLPSTSLLLYYFNTCVQTFTGIPSWGRSSLQPLVPFVKINASNSKSTLTINQLNNCMSINRTLTELINCVACAYMITCFLPFRRPMRFNLLIFCLSSCE
jgi:hypothetical protein